MTSPRVPSFQNPFIDPAMVRGALYASPTRIRERGGGLYAAKTAGPNAAKVIADLAEAAGPVRSIVDVGGGTGSIARYLAARLSAASVVLLDQSLSLLDAAGRHDGGADKLIAGICGDFHRLPLADAGTTVAVAAFCLYHSPNPEVAVAELARCTGPSGRVVIATKAADSYAELDQLVTASRLDPYAEMRPSLYATFHSANAAEVAASALRVDDVVHHCHEFRFTDFDRLASYLATSPKYEMPASCAGAPHELARELRRRLPEQPFTMTSTVTYIAGSAR